MRTFDTLPGESNTSIISSIINLVCPQCGGRMSEFQCEGRCCRNWLAEWEWANQATKSLQVPREATLAGRCAELPYSVDSSLTQVLMDITQRVFPARTRQM